MTDPSLARYQILSEIAAGGMGVVYHARDTQLGRDVALKVIRPGQASSIDLLRFSREAEAAAKVRHPGLVAVHDLGQSADGMPFLVCDLVRGGSLQDRLAREGPLPPLEAAALTEQVARALHAAHQAGVLHRDVKPANVLLTEAGAPLLTDFGLAKLVDVDKAGLTATGEVLGTPVTMAPEQALGEAERIGPATDVYGLGALLFALLTGGPPFTTGPLLKVLTSVLEDAPPRASSLRPDVPASLDAICARCLEKFPEDRYPSAAALADDLGRVARGESLEWVDGGRPLKIAVGLVALAAIAGLAWAASSRPNASAPPETGTRPAVAEPSETPLPVARPAPDTRPLIERLASAHLPEHREVSHTPVSRKRARQDVQKKTRELNAVSAGVLPGALPYPLLTLRGKAKLRLGDLEGALSDLTQALSHQSEPGNLAYVYRGIAHARRGDVEAAMADLTPPLNRGVRLIRDEHHMLRAGYLGMLHEARGDVEASARFYAEAVVHMPSDRRWLVRRGLMLLAHDVLRARCDLLQAGQEGSEALTRANLAPPPAAGPPPPKIENSARPEYGFFVGDVPDDELKLLQINALVDLAIESLDPERFTVRGQARLRIFSPPERWASGLADLTHALHLDPLYLRAWIKRAQARCDLGDLAGAEADATQALLLVLSETATLPVDEARSARWPTLRARRFRARGFFRLRLGDAEGALSDLEHASALGADRQTVLFAGYALWKLGRAEEARKHLWTLNLSHTDRLEAIEAMPDPTARRDERVNQIGITQFARGLIKLCRGETEPAREQLKLARKNSFGPSRKNSFGPWSPRRALIDEVLASLGPE